MEKKSKDKVQEHLKNRDDKISEEDIRNMEVDKGTPAETEKEEKEHHPKKEMPTSWDILD